MSNDDRHTGGLIGRRSLLGMSAATAVGVVSRVGWAATRAQPMFDSHIHVISEDVGRYPRVRNEVPPGGAPGGTAPPGASVGIGKPHPVPTREAVTAWWNANGVEAGALVQKRGTYGFDNSYVLDSADGAPRRMVPVVVLDAQDAGTPGKIDAWVRQHGLAGVRLTGPMQADGSFPWLSSPAALDTWKVAARHGLVVDLMYVPPGYSAAALREIVRLAVQFPSVRVVLDHVGWPQVRGAPDYGMDAEFLGLVQPRNMLFKFTTINLDLLQEARIDSASFVKRAVASLGSDRIMWGSDMGNSPGTYDEMVMRVMAATATLRPRDRQAMLHETGKRTFARGGIAA